MKLYVANWWHTWGEYVGTAGIFSTYELAEDALKRLAPKCYACGPTSNQHGGAGYDIDIVILNKDGEKE